MTLVTCPQLVALCTFTTDVFLGKAAPAYACSMNIVFTNSIIIPCWRNSEFKTRRKIIPFNILLQMFAMSCLSLFGWAFYAHELLTVEYNSSMKETVMKSPSLESERSRFLITSIRQYSLNHIHCAKIIAAALML
jgi:hypothetical protein